MYSEFLPELAGGLAMLAAAVLTGGWLFGHSRRRPESILVNTSMLADMVCVGEVALLVGGLMLMLRAFVDLA